MCKILTITAMAGLFSTMALAATWTGTLVDATCMSQYDQSVQNQQQRMSACIPTDATSNFAIVVNGQVLVLDAPGNQKAQSALQNRAGRAQNPNQPSAENAPVTAKVTGTRQANTIKTQTLTIEMK
jgi:hypothetical protein